jgi:hypothetical protein
MFREAFESGARRDSASGTFMKNDQTNIGVEGAEFSWKAAKTGLLVLSGELVFILVRERLGLLITSKIILICPFFNFNGGLQYIFVSY